MSSYEKLNYLKYYVTCECYCIWGLFVENVGGQDDIIQELKDCNSESEIREFVSNYI